MLNVRSVSIFLFTTLHFSFYIHILRIKTFSSCQIIGRFYQVLIIFVVSNAVGCQILILTEILKN